MKTISGLNYNEKIHTIIKETITNAKNNPFNNYYIIVKDPLFFEEAFFKYTDTLFNITIITYKDLINKLLLKYHLNNYQELSKLDKLLFIKNTIETHNNLFNTDSKMDLSEELINIFDIFYQYDLQIPDLSNQPALAKNKLETIISLYQCLIDSLDEYTCYGFETILLNKMNKLDDSFIFITDDIFTTRRYQLINQLAKFNDVTILINQNNDSRRLNIPFNNYSLDSSTITSNNDYINHLNNYLFSLQSPKFNMPSPLYQLIQTTPKAQIQSVVLNIYQDIVDKNMRYKDFAIYYPNNDYLTLIKETLDSFKIPHNIKDTLVYKELDACMLWLQYNLTKDNDTLINLLDTKVLNRFNDYNYLDVIKKNYLEKGVLDNPFEDYLFTNNATLSDYCHTMITFINNEFLFSQNQMTLISFFNSLATNQLFTLKDFYQLVDKLKPILKEDKIICQDHVYVLDYNQCYSDILACKKIYLVGVNETIVPTQIKDTGILLDQDYQLLNLPDLNYHLGINDNNILKVLNSTSKFIAICFSNATIDGQPLLKSSLYEELKQMFHLTNIDITNDYLHYQLKYNLYLHGVFDDQLPELNNLINNYQLLKNQPVSLTNKLTYNQLSASLLETYNSCPYKYFNQYRLKLYPFASPIFQSNEIGTIVHYVLECTKNMFSDNISAISIDFSGLQDNINSLVNQYLNDHELINRINHPINNYIIKMIKKDLYNTIIVLNKHMQVSDFKLNDSEVVIKRKYPNFKFNGIVDRIDQYDKYLKIIDYKSSNKDLDISLALQGFNIQMLLYLDTLCSNLDLDYGALLYFNTKKRILGSSLKITEEENSDNFIKLYKMNGYVNEEVVEEIDNNIDRSSNIINAKFVKKDDCYKGNILSSYSFERLCAYVTKHIEELYQQLLDGNISTSPKGSDDATIHSKVNPCTYCNYRSICNFDVFYNEYTLVDSNNLEYLIKEEE